ncbi:MAG: DUF368 domain-containing protein [Lachnospiraceae bacterium]|nr:DUF368 domain-containing protein [Lachnospiraceae bacterium]
MEKTNCQTKQTTSPRSPFLLKIVQGALIGLGAVLPGISGGVLCVVFGIYQTVMELLADPIHHFKTHVPKLIPIGIGGVIGFMGIANLLSVLLERYPAPSVCVFIGLISGMLPSLYREAGEKGKSKHDFKATLISMVITFVLLISLQIFSIEIQPGFFAYIFCGVCLALSVIVPGMSFSTLLMPLGLYTPFVSGIGHMDFSILFPAGLGALATVILLSRLINRLFERYYSIAFHAIIGVVIAATILIIPFSSFLESKTALLINICCLGAGGIASLLLDRFNQRYSV